MFHNKCLLSLSAVCQVHTYIQLAETVKWEELQTVKWEEISAGGEGALKVLPRCHWPGLNTERQVPGTTVIWLQGTLRWGPVDCVWGCPSEISKVQIHPERKRICLPIRLLSKKWPARTVFSCFSWRGIPRDGLMAQMCLAKSRFDLLQYSLSYFTVQGKSGSLKFTANCSGVLPETDTIRPWPICHVTPILSPDSYPQTVLCIHETKCHVHASTSSHPSINTHTCPCFHFLSKWLGKPSSNVRTVLSELLTAQRPLLSLRD